MAAFRLLALPLPELDLAALQTAIAERAATAATRVFALPFNGSNLWVKRAGDGRLPSSVRLQALLARLLRLDMLLPPRIEDGPTNLAAEAAALRKLTAAGWRVPDVVLLTDIWLVMRDAGDSVETLLNGLHDPARQRQLVETCGDYLVRLHQAGHWHGGAQIRNFCWSSEGPGFLDLEDHALPHMTLAERQARDIVLFLYSLHRYNRDPAHPLLAPVARRLVAAGSREVRRELARLHARIGWLIRLLRPIAPYGGRDLRQALSAEAALAEALRQTA